MKRIYACILIVAALLGVSLYSSGRVQGFAQDISADLDCALEAVRQKDFPTARQALAEGAELCDTMRESTATANTVLPQEILLLIGNETEDYFLLKKEGHQPGGKR